MRYLRPQIAYDNYGLDKLPHKRKFLVSLKLCQDVRWPVEAILYGQNVMLVKIALALELEK